MDSEKNQADQPSNNEPTTSNDIDSGFEPEVVWLLGAKRWAFLVSRGAYYSRVRWEENGTLFEETVENADYEFWIERAIEFEPDAD